MSEVEFMCPYCFGSQWLEIESMTEFDTWKEKCKYCNKEFEYRIEYSVEGYTDKIEQLDEAQGDKLT